MAQTHSQTHQETLLKEGDTIQFNGKLLQLRMVKILQHNPATFQLFEFEINYHSSHNLGQVERTKDQLVVHAHLILLGIFLNAT